MALSWNEIKERAVTFIKEWENTENEDADAKLFMEAFFHVFCISRKKIATFEHKVKKLNEHDGYIDLFWKGTMLVEMKSKSELGFIGFQDEQDLVIRQTIELPTLIIPDLFFQK